MRAALAKPGVSVYNDGNLPGDFRKNVDKELYP
jgi:hypothetical protein